MYKNRSSEIDDLIWSRGKEIAESKVRLSVSEILAKTNIQVSLTDEISSSGSQSSSEAILVVQAEGTRKDESVFQDMESNGNDVNEKVNEDAIVVDEVDKSKLYEGVANDTIKQFIMSKSLEDIWSIVMERLKNSNISVQSIESRIIDLTNWSKLEWSRILKHEDKTALMKSFNKKLDKEKIDTKVLEFIDNPSNNLKSLNDLQKWKTQLSTIGSEDAILASEVISFL